jgi:hypothetical protein
MADLTYWQQLKHPKWQRRRLEILQRDDFMCAACLATEKTLHVHHKRYVKGRMLWEYPDDELVALCDDCHAVEHERINEFLGVVAASWDSLTSLTDLVRGFSAPLIDSESADKFFRTASQMQIAGAIARQFQFLKPEDARRIYDAGKAQFMRDVFGDDSQG